MNIKLKKRIILGDRINNSRVKIFSNKRQLELKYQKDFFDYINWEIPFTDLNLLKNKTEYLNIINKLIIYRKQYSLEEYSRLRIIYMSLDKIDDLLSLVEINKNHENFKKELNREYKVAPMHIIFNRNWWK